MFYIVEFAPVGDRGKETAVVPANWFHTDGSCSWPDTMDTSRAARNSAPVQEKWRKYPARIIKAFDTYKEAIKWLPMSEETSDLSSASESRATSSRKRKATERYLLEESDDESSEQLFGSGLPPPPAYPLRELNIVEPDQITLNSDGLASLNHSQRLDYRILNLDEVLDRDYDRSSRENHNGIPNTPSPISRRQPNNPISSALISSAAQQPEEWTISDLSKYVVENMTKFRATQRQIELKLDILLSRDTSAGNLEEDLGIPGAPFPTLEKLMEFDQKLDEADFKKSVAVKLEKEGGSNCYDTVSRIMKTVMLPVVAKQFSLYGRGQKKSFSSLNLKKLVCDAAVNNRKVKPTCEQVDKSLQSFFSHVIG